MACPLGDRQLDPDPVRQIAKNGRRRQSLDHLADLGDRLLRSGALRDQLAGTAVAAEPAPAGDDQVAHPGEPGERLRASTAGRRQARHLRQPARDQRGLGVVAETEPVHGSGGERDHVLRRRAELDTDQVGVDVDAEDQRVDLVLEPDRELLVLGRDDGRGRESSAISWAKFGPERTATLWPVRSVESRLPVAGSSPLVRLSTGGPSGSIELTWAKTWLGTAITTRSASSSGASATEAARTSPRSTSGR